jgi:hypothetical protein
MSYLKCILQHSVDMMVLCTYPQCHLITGKYHPSPHPCQSAGSSRTGRGRCASLRRLLISQTHRIHDRGLRPTARTDSLTVSSPPSGPLKPPNPSGTGLSFPRQASSSIRRHPPATGDPGGVKARGRWGPRSVHPGLPPPQRRSLTGVQQCRLLRPAWGATLQVRLGGQTRDWSR